MCAPHHRLFRLRDPATARRRSCRIVSGSPEADNKRSEHAIAQTILDKGNDYLLVVKENKPTLHAEIATLFADPDAVCTVATETTSHSQRHERRVVRASTELVGYSDWSGLAQVVCMERQVTNTHTGYHYRERAYAVTSLSPVRATAMQF